MAACENPFSIACRMRPYQELLVDCEACQDYAAKLLARIAGVESVFRLKAVNPEGLPFLHSGGNVASMLPDLIECGYAAVHPIDPQ